MNKMQKFQNWLARRVEQWRRVAVVVGLMIQGATLSGVIYGLLAPHGIAWWVAPGFFIAVLLAAFTAAWGYYGVLGMRAAEQHARFDLDARDQTMLSPKEAKLLALFVRGMRGDNDALAELEKVADAQQID